MTIAAQTQQIALEFASNAQHRAFAPQSKLAEMPLQFDPATLRPSTEHEDR